MFIVLCSLTIGWFQTLCTHFVSVSDSTCSLDELITAARVRSPFFRLQEWVHFLKQNIMIIMVLIIIIIWSMGASIHYKVKASLPFVSEGLNWHNSAFDCLGGTVASTSRHLTGRTSSVRFSMTTCIFFSCIFIPFVFLFLFYFLLFRHRRMDNFAGFFPFRTSEYILHKYIPPL